MRNKLTHMLYSVSAMVAGVVGAGAGMKWSDARLKSDVDAVENAIARLTAL